MHAPDDLLPSDATRDISLTLTESIVDAIELIRSHFPDDQPSRSYIVRLLLRQAITDLAESESPLIRSRPA